MLGDGEGEGEGEGGEGEGGEGEGGEGGEGGEDDDEDDDPVGGGKASGTSLGKDLITTIATTIAIARNTKTIIY